MPNGSLRVFATAASQAVPVADVTVCVLDENGAMLAHLRTGPDGSCAALPLPAPDRAYSLDENNTTVRPYAVYTLLAQKPGWRALRLEGVQVFDGQESVARLTMLPAGEAAPAPADAGGADIIAIPPHPLFAGNAAAGGSGRTPRATCPLRVLPQVVVPKLITVHLGAPNAAATNLSVNFQDYIATVASCEVYPTWAGATKHTRGRAPQ